MSEPLASVIIPAYNHEKYIIETLKSIIEQSYKNIELIVLNDGSTDKTNDRVKSIEGLLRERFSNYVYINKENEGICKTLNRGLCLAKGKYIFPFSSDDLMKEDRIKKQITYLEIHKGYGAVYSDVSIVISRNSINFDKSICEDYRVSNYLQFTEGDLFEFMLDNVIKMPATSLCIRRECYDRIGLYDESLIAEDIDMFLRLSKYFYIGCMKEVFVIHRIHDTNMGRSPSATTEIIAQLKEKYSRSTLLTENEKQRLFNTFYYYAGL